MRSAFFEEFIDLIVALISADSKARIYDMNCLGCDCNHINSDLVSLFGSFCLKEHINIPIRGDNLFDIFATKGQVSVSGLVVDDARLISDHCLVYAKLRSRPLLRKSTYRKHTYRNICVDIVVFEDSVAVHALHRSGADHRCLCQSWRTVLIELEKVAPCRTAKRRQPKSIQWWLSSTAISLKHEQHRLKKVWNRSVSELDHIVAQEQWQGVNTLINQAHHNHNSQQSNTCCDSKSF